MECVERTPEKITFRTNNREYTRKLSKDREFRFENETYFLHYSFSMGYGSTEKIYKVTDELKALLKRYSNLGWTGVEAFIRDISEEYSESQRETSHVPAGPDTSKFSATVSGFIRPMASPSTLGQSQYSCGSYFHKALQVGGNAKTKPELFEKLRYVLPRLSKPLGYTGSDTKVAYKESLGTNFSTYGIG